MKKYLFVNPPTKNGRKITRNCDCASESKGNYLLQPFDLLYLSAKIPHADQLQFIDSVASGYDQKMTLDLIKDSRPDIVVTTMADVLWGQDLQFLKELNTLIAPSQIYTLGDALVEQQAADEVKDLCNGIISSPLEVINFDQKLGMRTKNTYTSVDKNPKEVSLGIPRHDIFKMPQYRWPFSSYKSYTSVVHSWGCPYSCAYCIDSRFPSLFRIYQEIIEEMSLIKKLGFQEIVFTDKSFGLPKNNLVMLLEKMIEKKFNFSWSTYIHPNQIQPDLISLMKKAGCHTVIIGIEDVDHKGLHAYKRRTNPDLIRNAIQLAQKNKINVCGDFLFGLSYHQRESIISTIEYSLTLGLDFASFNIAAPLPGSQIRNEAILDGRLSNLNHGFDPVGRGGAMDSKYCSAEDLIDLRNFAVKKFYLRPKYLLNRVKKLRGAEHFAIQAAEMFQLFKKTLYQRNKIT